MKVADLMVELALAKFIYTQFMSAASAVCHNVQQGLAPVSYHHELEYIFITKAVSVGFCFLNSSACFYADPPVTLPGALFKLYLNNPVYWPTTFC